VVHGSWSDRTLTKTAKEAVMTIRKGDRAPAFQLPQGPGEVVDLAEHIGRDKVVLLFFPLAFSSVCTAELCKITSDWVEWDELDARVFGISIDSPFVVKRFREEEGIGFPLLSDFNKTVAAEYGVLYEELVGLKGVAKRSAFVIDRSGTVVYDWVSEDSGVEPDYEAIKRAVEAA
jgi:peroxiredoxin